MFRSEVAHSPGAYTSADDIAEHDLSRKLTVQRNLTLRLATVSKMSINEHDDDDDDDSNEYFYVQSLIVGD